MKFLALSLLSLISVVPSLSAIAHADAYSPQHGFKYRVTYAQWDSGFSGYYGYSETCSRTYTGYGVYKTCYDTNYFTPSSYVYIEELQMSGGYHRINVYRDEAATELYVSYDVYEDGNIRRVERRDFYGDSVFVAPYCSSQYYIDQTVWNQLNWNEGFDLVMVGAYTDDIGLQVLANAHNSDEAALGLASLALGSISSVAGVHQMQQSELEQAILNQKTFDGTDVLR